MMAHFWDHFFEAMVAGQKEGKTDFLIDGFPRNLDNVPWAKNTEYAEQGRTWRWDRFGRSGKEERQVPAKAGM